MKEEKKVKDEMDIEMPQMPYMGQMPPMPQMPYMGQMPPMPQMSSMGQMPPMGQMPMMCCPYLMNLQCPMMYGQGMTGPVGMMNPYTANPFMTNQYMQNPMMMGSRY